MLWTKIICYVEEARRLSGKGVDQLASHRQDHSESQGPGYVVLDKKFGAPSFHQRRRDHRQVEIELEDPFENMGAQLVKEVPTKTNDVASDGTITATLLAQAIVKERA